MAGFLSKALPFLGGAAFSKTGREFLGGKEGKFKEISTLTDEQQPLLQQLMAMLSGQDTEGVFGDLGNYYRSLLSDDSADFDAMAAPEMRRFNEDIIPGLSEQFAGMGSGALSSSGFRNAAVNAGTDLSERLGALRSQLRQQGVQGLTGLSQMGLNPYKENIYQQRTPGFLENAAQGAGSAATKYFGGF